MADGATVTKARAKAREPAPEKVARADAPREQPREMVRPGALTYTHPVTGELLVRDTQVGGDKSPYDIPRNLWPEGMVYAWRRESTAGEPDAANIASLKRNGWREVPAERHPEYQLRLDGLILMECPEPFVAQSRKEDAARARAASNRNHRPRVENTRSGYFDDEVPAARPHNYTRREAPQPSDPAWQPKYRSVDIDS